MNEIPACPVAVVGLVRVVLFGMTTPDGMGDIDTLSISQFPRLVVDVLKPMRPRLPLPVSSAPLLSVALVFNPYKPTKIWFRKIEKLFADSVRYEPSGPR